LKDGEIGQCKVRQNLHARLIALSYGNVSALHVDPIEKKPLYHFLPGSKSFSISTNGCVLSCLNCQNWQLSQSAVDELSSQKLKAEQIVDLALQYDCKSISYTYTDPVVYYEYMMDIAQIAQSRGLKNVMVSSGFINPKPLKELIPFLDAANIDLKCFDDLIYQKLNGARLKPVLKALELINASDVWLEITNLIIPGWTDNASMITEMCEWLMVRNFEEVPLHFNRFMPAYQLKDADSTPLRTLESGYQIAKKAGLKYVYIGNVYEDRFHNTYCPNCNAKLLTRISGVKYHNLAKNGKCSACEENIRGVWV